MLCVKCGKKAPLNHRPRMRLRPTGRADEPFAIVCESCGVDINADGTPVETAAETRPVGLAPHLE